MPRDQTALFESSAWKSFPGGWKQLWGNFDQRGLSVEVHDLEAPTTVDWGASFHEDSIEICLNMAGHGVIETKEGDFRVLPRSLICYLVSPNCRAIRASSERHRFLTFEASREYLQKFCDGEEHHLHPVLRDFVQGKRAPTRHQVVFHQALDLDIEYRELCKPSVGQGALAMFYQAQFLHQATRCFFLPEKEELFCHRQQRVEEERIDLTKQLLLSDLSDPPSLTELGKRVGCSATYLSRIFSRQMGMTIPQFMKQERIKKAAELLRSGRFNVTETALEVGYKSLSHFSKVFYEVTGCCPGLYPNEDLFQKPTPIDPRQK